MSGYKQPLGNRSHHDANFVSTGGTVGYSAISDDKVGILTDDSWFPVAVKLTIDMITASNRNIFCGTGPLCGEFTSHRWIPLTKTVTRSFDVFFDLRLNKRLSKQLLGWWFETPLRSLWRHYNVMLLLNHVILTSKSYTELLGDGSMLITKLKRIFFQSLLYYQWF